MSELRSRPVIHAASPIAAFHVRESATLTGCPFADKYLRTFTIY